MQQLYPKAFFARVAPLEEAVLLVPRRAPDRASPCSCAAGRRPSHSTKSAWCPSRARVQHRQVQLRDRHHLWEKKRRAPWSGRPRPPFRPHTEWFGARRLSCAHVGHRSPTVVDPRYIVRCATAFRPSFAILF